MSPFEKYFLSILKFRRDLNHKALEVLIDRNLIKEWHYYQVLTNKHSSPKIVEFLLEKSPFDPDSIYRNCAGSQTTMSLEYYLQALQISGKNVVYAVTYRANLSGLNEEQFGQLFENVYKNSKVDVHTKLYLSYKCIYKNLFDKIIDDIYRTYYANSWKYDDFVRYANDRRNCVLKMEKDKQINTI